MQIKIDPMPVLRVRAAEQINAAFAQRAAAVAHVEGAHATKAAAARLVAAGGEASASFAAEATMRGIAVDAFARLVVAKADAAGLGGAAARELSRQGFLLAIERAQSQTEIDQILTEAGVARSPTDQTAQ